MCVTRLNAFVKSKSTASSCCMLSDLVKLWIVNSNRFHMTSWHESHAVDWTGWNCLLGVCHEIFCDNMLYGFA